MEAKSGIFDDWPVQDQMALVRMLVEAGEMEETEDVKRLLVGGLPEEEARQLAVKIAIDWQDVALLASPLTTLEVLQGVMGGFGNWTLEQRAWFSQVMLEAGIGENDFPGIHLVPQEGDIQQEEAVQIAKRALEAAYGLNEGALEEMGVWVEFIAPYDDPDAPIWEIVMRGLSSELPVMGGEMVGVSPKTGEMVEATNRGVFLPEFWAAEWRERKTFAADEVYQAVEAFGDGAIQRAGRFYRMTLAEKAQWSQEIRPLVLAAMEASPGLYEEDVELMSQVTYVYGLPSEGDIPEADALAIAEKSVMEAFGLELSVLRAYDVVVTFDVTDEARPLWKFYFCGITQALKDLGYDMPWGHGYKVEIDAGDGEVLLVKEAVRDEMTRLEASLIWI